MTEPTSCRAGGVRLTSACGEGAIADPTDLRSVHEDRELGLGPERRAGAVVTGEAWTLAAICFCSGLAAGLLGMLCTIMRPMLTAMTGRDFRTFMETFLQYAGHGLGKAFNYVWSFGMFLGPIVAMVFLWDDLGSVSFVLTAIGFVIVTVGIIIVSNAVKTPHYELMLSWDPDNMPADWEAGRQRYFNINWLQMVTTWAAFILFLLALCLL
jgi:hypothetical protein